MRIAYTSESKIYLLDNGNKTEIPCGRIIKYRETLESIRRKNEWKTTGRGAQFTGAAMNADFSAEIYSSISGLSSLEDNGELRLIYGAALDGSSSLYHRSTDRNDDAEGLILSGNFRFGAFDCYKGKMAVSMSESGGEMHIAVIEPPSSAYEELTGGDTVDSDPYWSRCQNNRIYFSTAGNARTESGAIGDVSPRSGAYIDIAAGELNEFLSDPKYDHLKIKDDSFGNIYFIRQPYGGERPKEGTKLSDIFFFPIRLLKGLFGWLNFMSTIWGGEPLKSGSDGLPSNQKAKQRDARDIIIDGNLIKAEKLAEEADRKDSEPKGLMPLSRVLIKREADGTETVIKRGVLDYSVCSDGSLIISDGRRISRFCDGEEKTVAKAYLAMNLTEM